MNSLIQSATAWWETMNLAGQIFYGIALLASLVIGLLALLSIIGMEIHDADIDHPDVDDGNSLFSIKPIVGFLFAFGWAGGASLDNGLNLGVAIVLGLISGTIALFGIAWLLKATKHLKSDGNLKKETAVGKIASVYVTIPAANSGAGQVTVPLDGRTITMGAIQTGTTPLPADAKVKVLALIDNDTVRVEAIA